MTLISVTYTAHTSERVYLLTACCIWGPVLPVGPRGRAIGAVAVTLSAVGDHYPRDWCAGRAGVSAFISPRRGGCLGPMRRTALHVLLAWSWLSRKNRGPLAHIRFGLSSILISRIIRLWMLCLILWKNRYIKIIAVKYKEKCKVSWSWLQNKVYFVIITSWLYISLIQNIHWRNNYVGLSKSNFKNLTLLKPTPKSVLTNLLI